MKLIQSGPRETNIVLVGEAPGAKEDERGVPFVGASGEILNKMLSRAGVNRDDCFLTNLVHVRPPDNDFDWFLKPANHIHLLLGIAQLKKDLSSIRPNVVCALGAKPLQILTGKVGIEKWRGSILESTLLAGQKVIATYHPAFILRSWDYKAVAEFDLQRVAHDSTFPELRLPQREHILDPPEPLRSELVRLLCQATILAIDIECTPTPEGRWRLACVGFSDHPGRGLVIACDDALAMHHIRELCASGAKKVFQNGTFDVTILSQSGVRVNNYYWDTMLAHHSLFAECASGSDEISILGGRKRQAAIAKGLAFQASIYTREPFYKDDGKVAGTDLQQWYLYNSRDACVTREIQQVQDKELTEFGVRQVFDHEMSLIEPFIYMTDRGILIDMEMRQHLRRQYETEIERLQNFLNESVGQHINVKSPKQMLELLYTKLNLPARHNRKTKNLTADKDAINDLASRYNHPILAIILKIRERRDYLERYINAPVDSDSRMRCSFDITGTRSGRVSSRQSIYGSGTNLQTIPHRKAIGRLIRRMFVSDRGKVFISRDYKQAEAVIVAHISRCQGLIELFDDPSRDIHKENAARIFNKPLSEVTKEERYLAKKVVHASNYGMGEKRLVDVVNEDAETTGIRIDSTKAKILSDKYFSIYPEIKSVFWRDVNDAINRTRTLNTPFGRKRAFFGRYDDTLLREAYSYIPQSTVGDLTCKAVARVYHDVQLAHPEWQAELLLTVHDSILVQCSELYATEVNEAMSKCMQIPIPINGREVIIPTDSKIGYNWDEFSEENPRGLSEV